MHLHSLLYILGGVIVGTWFNLLLTWVGPNITHREYGAVAVRWWFAFRLCYAFAFVFFLAVAVIWHGPHWQSATMFRHS